MQCFRWQRLTSEESLADVSQISTGIGEKDFDERVVSRVRRSAHAPYFVAIELDGREEETLKDLLQTALHPSLDDIVQILDETSVEDSTSRRRTSEN